MIQILFVLIIYVCFYDSGLILNIKFRILCFAYINKNINDKLIFRMKNEIKILLISLL